MKYLHQRLASETLVELTQLDKRRKTSLKEIMHKFHENGFALILIFFSLPIAIPLPYPPGFTTLFGVPLIILSVQMLLGFKSIKLPEFLENYELPNSTLVMLFEKATPILQKFEQYLKPRIEFAGSVWCEQFVGVISLICAIAIALPIPFTNSIPAWGITIMSLGLLKRDGLVIIAGFFVAIIGLIIATSATLAVIVGMKYLLS